VAASRKTKVKQNASGSVKVSQNDSKPDKNKKLKACTKVYICSYTFIFFRFPDIKELGYSTEGKYNRNSPKKHSCSHKCHGSTAIL